ncbi:MAG: TlpA family protein disulfide reductase [Anaerolineales bacterium]|nr:TlpA family protein disulfide reductase [Anaerolineales bacterium]
MSPKASAPWLLLASAVLFGLGIGLVVFLGFPAAPEPPPAGLAPSGPGPAPVVGAPAPDFTLETLDGRSVSLSDYRGQVVLLNFWATWCGPCKLEMPSLERAQQSAGAKGFQVLAVNFDESEADVQGFQDELGLSFPLLLDPGAVVQRLYRVLGYPTSYWIDRDGTVAAVHIGMMSERQLADYLQEMGLEA